MADESSDEPEYRGFLTLEIRKNPQREGAGSLPVPLRPEEYLLYEQLLPDQPPRTLLGVTEFTVHCQASPGSLTTAVLTSLVDGDGAPVHGPQDFPRTHDQVLTGTFHYYLAVIRNT